MNSTLVNAIDIGIDCSLSGEMYESMLVEVANISFDSVDEYGNWTISDNSGSTMVDDYHFDSSQGGWPNLSPGDSFECLRGVVSYSYSEFKIYPRTLEDFSCLENDECIADGDVSQDDIVNVIDIVTTVNYVLGTAVPNEAQSCAADMNADSVINVIDIIILVNLIIES
jgi:hypothetical protein